MVATFCGQFLHVLWEKIFLHKSTKSRGGPVKSTETRLAKKHKKIAVLQKNCGNERLKHYSTSVARHFTGPSLLVVNFY